MTLKEIQARLEEIADRMTALGDLLNEASGDDVDTYNDEIIKLQAEFDELEKKRDKVKKVDAAVARIAASRRSSSQPTNLPANTGTSVAIDALPRNVRNQRSRHFHETKDAYDSGMFVLAVCGNRWAQNYCKKEGILQPYNAQSVGDDTKGGYTVPTPLSDQLINLIENYGVMRQKARRIVMTAMTWTVPKVVGHTTVMYPAEAAVIDPSDMTFAQVTLTAKKAAQLTLMSTEVTEDSIISMIDTVVDDMAWNFAKSEDENGFNGGNGFTGIAGATMANEVTVANVGALALTDLTACMSALNNYRGLVREWYMNSNLWLGTIIDLLTAAGGTRPEDITGGPRPSLYGYPVNFVEAMPGQTAGASTQIIVFGDMRQAVYFGDRRMVNFRVLNELYAVTDQVAVLSTQRYDIQNASPEALNRIVTGP